MSLTEPTAVPASAGRGDPPVTVVILTFNEAENIAECLRSCTWSDDVHVVDSGSTDRTREIAAQMGAHVHVNPFQSFGQQRNWAIDNVEHKHDWVFHLDADERFTPDLVTEMRRVVATDPPDAGFYVPHKMIFMGRWLKHAEGGYPIYQMRFFHKARMRFHDYGHGQREEVTQPGGKVGVLSRPYLHYNFSKGLEEWIDKHNRYSTLEAMQIFRAQQDAANPRQEHEGRRALLLDSLFGNAVERRRFFKGRVYPKLPGRWIWRFVWMYFIRLGMLDGRAGLEYCLLMSCYELFTALKVNELRRQAEGRSEHALISAMASNPAGAPGVPALASGLTWYARPPERHGPVC